MTLKKNDCESYPMARGAKFDYGEGGSAAAGQGRRLAFMSRCIFIQWILFLFMLAYLILLTVWLYPTFPMFSTSPQASDGIYEEVTALKVRLVEAQNQSEEDLSQWKKKIDQVDVLTSQQEEYSRQNQQAVQLLLGNAQDMNESLYETIERLQVDLGEEKAKRTKVEKSVAALMRRVSDFTGIIDDLYSKYDSDLKNISERLVTQENKLTNLYAFSRNDSMRTHARLANMRKTLNSTIIALKIYNGKYILRFRQLDDRITTSSEDYLSQSRAERNESIIRIQEGLNNKMHLVEDDVKNISASLEEMKRDDTKQMQLKVLGDKLSQIEGNVSSLQDKINKLELDNQMNVVNNKARIKDLINSMVDHEHNIENLMNQSHVLGNSSEGLRQQLESTKGKQSLQHSAVNHSLSAHGHEIQEVKVEISAIQEEIKTLRESFEMSNSLLEIAPNENMSDDEDE